MGLKTKSVVLILSLLFCTAISIVSLSEQEASNLDHIYYATTHLPETVDPHWACSDDKASRELIQNVYEPLCMFDGTAVDKFIPLLADWWPGIEAKPSNCIKPSPPDPGAPPGTYETWYFRIRTGVQWQEPAYGNLTTEDVEYSFERGMLMDHSGGNGGPMWMFYQPLLDKWSSWDYDFDGDGVINETEYLILDADINNAIQRNDTYVWFNLRKPYPAFQQILSQTWAMIICKQWAIEKGCWNGQHGNYTEFLRTHDPPEPGPLMEPQPEIMGTGPYELQAINLDPHTGWYTLKKFDDYWRGWPAPGSSGFATYATVKKIEEWVARKYAFLSGQVDYCDVPKEAWNEMGLIPGIRMVRVPKLYLGALCFAYNMSPSSPYMQKIGTMDKPDLFSDLNMRLAFAHCLNFTEYIQTAWIDGYHPSTCLPNGTLYFNSSKPVYDLNLDLATQYFQNAWNGQVWTQGITVYIIYDFGNILNEKAAKMLKDTIENLIEWPPTANVSIISLGLPWSEYLQALRNQWLCCFFEYLKFDAFPDPNPWIESFMHPIRGIPAIQKVNYSVSPYALPYTNALGETVTEINNTYVAHLIEIGFTLNTCSLTRHLIYEELMDIYHAETSQLPLVQFVDRHFERTWLHGWVGTWNENPICPGDYFYTMWKEPPTAYVDISVSNINIWPWWGSGPAPMISNNITRFLIDQGYHAPRPGVPWMKLDPTIKATCPLLNVTAYITYYNETGPTVLIAIVWFGSTSKGHFEEFHWEYDLISPGETIVTGPGDLSNVYPPVGNYNLWVCVFVLGNLKNINATKDFYGGWFKALGFCDINADNLVEIKDYQLVKGAVGSTPGSPRWNWAADVNCSWSVTVSDYQMVKARIPTIYPDP